MEDLEGRVRKLEQTFAAFAQEIRLAYRYIHPDSASSLTKSRIVMEKILLKIYKAEMGKEPRKPLLGDMLADNQFTRKLDRRILSRMNAIRDMGNLGPHGEAVQPNDAERVLDDLCTVLDWCLSRYASKMRKRRASGEATPASQPAAPSPTAPPPSAAEQPAPPAPTPAAVPTRQPVVPAPGHPKAKSKAPVIALLLCAGLGLVLLGGVCATVLLLSGWGSNARGSRDSALVARSTGHADQPTGKEASQPAAAPKEPEPGPPPPVPLTKQITNGIGMKLVPVPKGTFWMGDRGSQEQVPVEHDFYIGVYLVTQEQWQAVMERNPSYFSRSGDGADKVKDVSDDDLKQFPVEQVSWDDVQEFLKALNAREKDRGFLYRLPSVAEWEYACRGGATSQEDCAFDFYCAQPSNDLSSEQANFDGRKPAGSAPQGQYLERTSKVGSYQPNRLGIYDMHGNVYEWCADPSPSDGLKRMCRGGCWFDSGSHCGASWGIGDNPSFGSLSRGVRLAAVPSAE
jgi:formylglycine-generating enzyme required for sulfatase activity